MRKTTKKLLAVLLAMTVTLTMMPTMALAGDTLSPKAKDAYSVNGQAKAGDEEAGDSGETVPGGEIPDSQQKIKVTFTLRGDAKHGDRPHTDYEAWISKRAFEFDRADGATVLDVMETALKDAGISYIKEDSGFISEVNGLTYGDNGPNSGWMYLVNGEQPSVGAGEMAVKDSDSILFYYTDDYMNDDSMVEGKPVETEAEKLARLKKGVEGTALGLRTSADKSGLALTWTKSKGYKVDGYEIYRGRAKDGLTKYASTAKTSYKNARYLKKGTSYYYKVRGYRILGGEKVFTQWSKTWMRTAKANSVDTDVRETAVAVKAAAGKGTVTLTWKKFGSAKADGFEIYKSTKKNTFGKTPYITVKNGAAAQYKDTKGLKKGKTYYYKVRGVRSIDGKNVYTKWSNAVSCVGK